MGARGLVSQLFSVVALTALTACPSARDVECLGDPSCDLAPGGRCVPSIPGGLWCAYPDAACPSGMRYSDFDVADGVAGVCVPEPVSLTLATSGYGAGSVIGTVSTSTVLDCDTGAGCEASVPAGTTLTLTATPAAGDLFFGWSGGGCAGTGPCTLAVTMATTVTATFDQCDRALVDTCDENANLYERCDSAG